MRGMTADTAVDVTYKQFQSTCPMRGMTLMEAMELRMLDEFQSTCPMRGMTYWRLLESIYWPISIHMPHAGHDRSTLRNVHKIENDFNPHAPCGA